MKRVRTYIADSDITHHIRCAKALSNRREFEVVGTATSGSKALKQLSILKPDVLLTELMLPELDGLTLIREACRLAEAPVCVVGTRLYSEVSIACALNSGAAHCLYKPLTYEHLPDILLGCYQAAGKQSIPLESSLRGTDRSAMGQSAMKLLTEAGIPARLSASQYLIECAMRLKADPKLLGNLTKELYPGIARQFSTSGANVERAVRTAIATAYDRGCLSDTFSHRPTNREFIAYFMSRLADPPE